jgi:hypothetical protein
MIANKKKEFKNIDFLSFSIAENKEITRNNQLFTFSVNNISYLLYKNVAIYIYIYIY